MEPPDDASARDIAALTDTAIEEMCCDPEVYAFSYWRDDAPVGIHECLGISVVKDHGYGRVGAACLLSRHVKPYMLPVVNAIRRMLDAVPHAEVWSTVDMDYEPGHRLVKVLGYRQVRTLTRHSPSGPDKVLYKRVQNVVR